MASVFVPEDKYRHKAIRFRAAAADGPYHIPELRNTTKMKSKEDESMRVCNEMKSPPARQVRWNRLLSSSPGELVLVTPLYVVLTLAMTYPLMLVWNRAIVGWQGDTEIFVWGLWWMRYALVDLHTNPGLTSFIFYPNTVNLLAADLGPMNGLLSLPLQQLIGVVGSYNVLYLTSFVVSGVGTYLLVRHLDCSRSAAFLAGAIFAFAPYRFAHSFGHFGLLSTEWIPFFALCLTRAIRERKSPYFVLTPLFFFMTVYSEAYYGLSLGMLSVAVFLLEWKAVSTRAFVKQAIAVGVPVSVLFAAPLLWSVIDAVARHSLSNATQSPWEVVWYSADLIAYVIPSGFSTFMGGYVSAISAQFTGNSSEYTVSLGYTPLFFLIYAVAKLRKVRDIRVWGIIMTAFLLLSFGPVLHIMGRTVFTDFKVSVPMPYIILYELLPFIRVTRAPSRFAVIVMLAASVIVGVAINEALGRISLRLPRPSRRMLTVAILGAILFEFAVAPIPVHVIPVSPFYNELASASADYVILDLPQDPRIGAPGVDVADLTYLYYQTIHHKRIVGGAIPRAAENILEFTDRAPIVSDLVYPLKCTDRCDSPDIVSVDAAVAQNVLAYYGITHVILHRDVATYVSQTYGVGLDKIMRLDQRLLSIFFDGYPPIYEDERISVYRVVVPHHFQPFLRLEYGWGPLEVFPMDIPTRWVSNESGVTIFNPTSTSIQFKFSATSLRGTRTLEVYADNQLVAALAVPENRFETFQIRLSGTPGKAITMRLHSREVCETPKNLGINEDPRCLSLAFRNLTVTELEAGAETVHVKQNASSFTHSIAGHPSGHAMNLLHQFPVRILQIRQATWQSSGLLSATKLWQQS